MPTCLERSIVCQGKVSANNTDTVANYTGTTENTFKDRRYKHRNSFRYESKNNSSELSKHVWELRKKGISMDNLKFTWSILGRATAHVNGSYRYNLCLTEKLYIITSQVKLLNKRSELISKCRHENKYYLSNYKDIPPGIS